MTTDSDGAPEEEGEPIAQVAQQSPGRVMAQIVRHPRRAAAAVGVSGIVIAVGAAAVTLAATRSSAIRENAAAYANGLVDAFESMDWPLD